MIGASSPIQRPWLNEHCSTLYASIKSGLEASLTKVKEFIASTVSFSMRNEFRREFCMTNVRRGIVMTFINFVLDTCEVHTARIGLNYLIGVIAALTGGSILYELGVDSLGGYSSYPGLCLCVCGGGGGGERYASPLPTNEHTVIQI
jgi:hypothetical protein